jgi:hypothetical protein
MQRGIQLSALPTRWRERAISLHQICKKLHEFCSSMKLSAAIRKLLASESQIMIHFENKTEVLELTERSLRRFYEDWEQNPSPLAFAPKYQSTQRKIPSELVTEFIRRSTGVGRSSDRCDNLRQAMVTLRQDWFDEKPIPGIGTWKEWWMSQHPGLQFPRQIPDFPVSERTLYRYQPSRAMRAWGSNGEAAARKILPSITRTRKDLRLGEVYLFDDVRLDLICRDDETMRPTEVRCYIAIDVATNFIPAFTVRAGNSVVKYDADQLVVRALQKVGIGIDYTTHLVFERGTMTMSEPAARTLEEASEGRIKVHKTRMNGGRTYIGTPIDAPSGHWMGKAVIESFMRRLHLALLDLPGQRGNHYRNQPASLGYVGHNQNPKSGTLIDQAKKLTEIELHFDHRIKLDCGLMGSTLVGLAMRKAIELHNNNSDHDYEGFGTVLQKEIAPGVWEDIS